MRRFAGRYVVVVMILAGVLFFAGLVAASWWLAPAAERFQRGGAPPTARQ